MYSQPLTHLVSHVVGSRNVVRRHADVLVEAPLVLDDAALETTHIPSVQVTVEAGGNDGVVLELELGEGE